MKRRTIIIASLASLLILAGIYILRLQSASAREIRQSLVNCARNIEIGDQIEKVEKLLANLKSVSVRTNRLENDFKVVRVNTPLAFGAKNWVLLVLFFRDRVVACGFRTNDSVAERPRDAPNDRVLPVAEKVWDREFGEAFSY